MALIPTHPVGLPGLFAMMAGGALFFAALFTMRAGKGGESAKRSGLSLAGILIQMIAFAATGLGPIMATLPPFGARAIVEALLVAALMLLCVVLFVSATRAMGANWSVVARMRAGHELVTSGVFARLRHPIYTGMACFLVAMAIAFGHTQSLIATVPLFALGTWIRIREEERLLRAEFGVAYDDYAARVKRFVPGVI